MTRPSRPRNLTLFIRIAGTLLSTGLFILLISRQKWDVVLAKAAGIALWAIPTALLFILISFAFNTLRWCILLWSHDVRISFWQAFRISWAGNFASNFLPSTIGGDGFRMLAVHPYTGSKTVSIGSVALDRIINMSAMACLLPAPLVIFGSTLRHLFGLAAVLPPGLVKLFEKYFPKVMNAFRAWASRPWGFVYAFIAAWPSNLFPMAASYLIARQLGISVNFWQVMSVQTVSYFLSVLPISVNGYGLREVAFTTLYSALGASVEQASTLAVVTRLVTVLATVPGAIWLSSTVTSAAGLEEAAEDLRGDPGQ